MIGGSADIDICKIPLSSDTIHRRIKDMSENIVQNTAKTLANSNFALQVDEITDITGNAQLIAFVRFIHENDIINQFLCCWELPDFTTGKHIFQVISSYLEEIKVSWKSCIGICTDGAPAMTGHLKGFVAHVKELNEDILVTHCFLHREALVTKFLPSDLKIVLEQCVKMVNYIKSRPLKSRLFSKLCQAMEAKYEYLLLHTEVRWLSRGKVISRVLKLKDEMKIFFEQNKNYEFVHLLEDQIWCTKLAYLSDIFVIFNNINSSMQGPNENILNSTDKLVGFKKQITLWKNKAQEGNLEKFESVPKDSYKTIKLIVVDHLTTLEERIIHYFPKLDIKKFDWVRNPFLITYTSVFDLTLNEEEELSFCFPIIEI
ncbi:SCAN domain-containing protein 3 [Trichonephila clavipes]|nr:SCAN domain-containing protein 3 [Trichonephila clavipes]